MEPGVPFALLGAVQLLALAGWAGLAGAAIARRGRRAPGLAMPVLLAGAVLLLVADGGTALAFDRSADDGLAVLRAGGLFLVAVGLFLGALRPQESPARQPRPPSPAAPPAMLSVVALPAVVALPGVVVPLGASATPALLGGLAGVLATLAALRGGRDIASLALASSLLLAGAAAATAPSADTDGGAIGVLALRGLSALLLLVALSLLARLSLLSKVVTAILGGVLVMAVAAVGVVGTVVVDSYDQQARDIVRNAADQRLDELNAFVNGRRFSASLLATPSICGLRLVDGVPQTSTAGCAKVLNQLQTRREFVVRVPRNGQPELLAQQPGTDLTFSELLGVAGIEAVQEVFDQTCRSTVEPPIDTFLTRLTGAEPSLVAVALAPDDCVDPPGRYNSVLVYGTRIDDTYAAEELTGTNTFSILVGDQIAASNGTAAERQQVLAAKRAVDASGGIDGEGVTVAADGLQPTFRFVPLPPADQNFAVLAVGRDSVAARQAQQDALRYLVGTALLTTLIVGTLGLLLGRRTVKPVRRLTLAAEQVAAGDLSVRTAEPGPDEVGALSRAFDSMTGSLSAVNEDLRTSADRVHTILTSVSEGLVATGADGLITAINPAALAMCGLDADDQALGWPLGTVLMVRTPTGETLALDSPSLAADGEVLRPDGVSTIVRVEVAALAGAEGGVVVVLRDTSREREIERMKTEFLSNVSHELRTPLTPIRGYADILATRKGLSAGQVATFAGTILSESLKMNRVVDLLVDVAAIEAGRVRTLPRPVSVASLVDGRLQLWRGKVPERATDLRRRLSRGLPAVHIDPDWVGKALDELIDNALKHTPAGTTVTLGAAAGPEGQVHVSVTDRGPGIAEADRAVLFSPFEQLDGSATRRVGGLGLGLSFVSQLAEHGGYRLSLVSDPGKGAEFTLELPASTELPADGGPTGNGLRPAAGGRSAKSRAGRRPAPEPGPGR